MNSRSTSNLSLKSSRSRKHSLTLSNTMGWLSRHSTQSSVSSFYKGNKNGSSSAPEPQHKPTRSIELVSHARHGPLGSGATVVRTPEEALHDSGIGSRPSPRPTLQRSGTSGSKPLESPPLPSLPIHPRDSSASEDDDYEEGDNNVLNASAGLSWPTPPSAIVPLPPMPSPPSLRSSLKAKSRSSVDVFRVPALPAHVAQSLPQPPFEPVLMSDVPSGVVDPSSVLVTVETSTTSYKTTFKTLTSRPSQLTSYLHYLFPKSRRVSDASSVYSTSSDDMSTYRNHLASQGLLPQAPVNVHIFLDRPSAPYLHILNYLRSPVGSAEVPETLPRAVQLQPTNSQNRLEALLELRDEASYLDLDELYKLCSDEIRQRQPVLQPRLPRTHSRGQNSNSTSAGYGVDSQHTSLSSMHTLLDRSAESPSQVQARELSAISDDHASMKVSNEFSSDFQPRFHPASKRSPPTPESWKDGRNSRSSTSLRGARRNDLMRPPQAGWI
ncbi:hypothetical protein J3R30DRAFT_3290075 [Lentinula aciculospora]|uniref:BTB domain-containing protein n=1 Tax=Lentinula aciculospora TaxID=153920 RepID=A0A9W9AD31_9AGAR|nr:hypothetical protein J3R30DRAFT_3290075 [Lentinula aciculospora]